MRSTFLSEDSSSSSPSSWQHWKRVGDEHYQRQQFDDALQAYRRGLLDTSISGIDKSTILSNMVACRLQLGGLAHARAAVQEAQQCVSLNPTWSKAYYRLGSALSATGESNQACNALQTCLRLDPNFGAARQLLVKELRRETTSRTSTRLNEDDDDDDHVRPPPQNPEYRGPQSSSTSDTAPTRPHQPQTATVDIDLDEDMSLFDRVVRIVCRTSTNLSNFYASQSETGQSLIKVGIVLIVLYIAFGGRFGLEFFNSQTRRRQGHYDGSDPYASYRRPTDSYYRTSSSYSSRQPPADDDYVYTRTRSNGGSWWNWGSPPTGWYGSSHGMTWRSLVGAAIFLYILRHHGLSAAALFVLNQYRYRGGGGWYGRHRGRRRGW